MNRTVEKIQLVNAPTSGPVHSSGSASFYPHLGLLSIATHIREVVPGLIVEVIDGSIEDLPSILAKLDADLIGISVLTPSYDAGLAIARKAKEVGAITVLGNDHATNRWRQILSRRPEVDYVICGDHGEVSLAMLIEWLRAGGDLCEVPALAFRRGSDVGVNLRVSPRGSAVGGAMVRGFDSHGYPSYDIGSLSIADRGLIAGESRYFENYQRAYGSFHAGRPIRQTTINVARGCAWGASNKRRCVFCDIYDLSERSAAPARAWAEVEYLTGLGYNFLYEVCDSFSSFAVSDDGFLAHMQATRPETIPETTEWFVYARAAELARDGVADRLRAFGARRLNLGIDSASDTILRGMSKGAGGKTNRKAVELCAELNMQMYVSFVFGSIGESRDSLRETVDFISWALGSNFVVSVDPSVLLPLPNAPAWEALMNPQSAAPVCRRMGVTPHPVAAASYHEDDILDTAQLSRDWVSTFCNCTYEDIIEARDQVVSLQKEHNFVFGGFGVRGF